MIPVILIEDEFLARVGMKTCVPWEEEGYEVVGEAESGEEGIILYQKYRPKLVITDIRLPHKSGIDLMREIRAEDREVKFIIISAYDDFEIAREAIGIGVEGYYVKGNLDPDELTALLRKLRPEFDSRADQGEDKTQNNYSLTRIYRTSQEEGGRTDEEKWIQEQEEAVYFLIMKLDNANRKTFAHMVSDFLKRRAVPGQVREEKGYVWALMAVREGRLDALLKEMESMFRRYVQCRVAVGVSQKYGVPHGLDQMIYEAVISVHGCREQGDKAYVIYRESDGLDAVCNRNLRKTEELIRLNQTEAAKRCIEEMFCLFGRQFSVNHYKRFLYKLAGILNDYDKESFAAEYYEELVRLLDVEESFRSIAQRLDSIGDKQVRKPDGNEYTSQAMEYVYGHYQERINTTKIAAAIHVSPNYLGKVFYSTAGEYLTDFINRVRIEHAKELLAGSGMSVGEVAEAVGIGDQHYFAKLFKKYCGISPKEYRKVRDKLV